LFDDDADYEPTELEASMLEADDYTPESYGEYLMAEVLLPNMGTVMKAKVIGQKRDQDGMPESYDEYLMAEVLLPNMGTVTKAKVIGWKCDQDGNPIGKRNANLILDAREYEVEFQDGATDKFMANIIAENLYSQVNSEGNSYSILDEIVDHKSDRTAVSKDDGYNVAKDGTLRPKQTMRGWKLLVSWKDGSMSWVPLKDMKEAYPVQIAEYAVVNKILEEPAFKWWAQHVLSMS
jgi:hypothetical protein